MKTIAWDVDDVLNNYMQDWLEQQWLADNPDCRISYQQIKENPPLEIIRAELTVYQASLDKYRLSPRFPQCQPTMAVLDWFHQHGSKYRHLALSTVSLAGAGASANWVFKHFGAWIRTFHFVPSKRSGQELPKYDNHKGDFLSWLKKVDLLIDDNPKNISLAKEAGIKTLLFPRPWNDQTKSVTEVLNEIS